MALFGAAFQIGRSALAAYQAAISITGQNIANVGNSDYTRLSGRLTAMAGGFSGVPSGAGVRLSSLQRHVDSALEARLRSSLGTRAGSSAIYRSLSEVESLYNELTDYDLSTNLSSLFNSFSQLQNDPDETTARNLVLSEAAAVVRTLRHQRSALVQQAADLNESITQSVAQADALAAEIADLNQSIVEQEARGAGYSAPLKDRRDALLRELAGLMDIQARERDNGSVSVFVGSEPLVEFNRSRGLVVESEQVDGLQRATVRFADNHGSVVPRDGEIAAQLAARDEYLVGQVQKLDQLARGLIYELNRVHSTGRGLIGYSELTANYAVQDATAALNSSAAGLTFPLENGTFVVHVRSSGGEEITRQIEVDLDGIGADTSLDDLAAQLADVPGLSAAVAADGRLELSADAGAEFWFTDDSSGALAALGLGSFLAGTDAATIDISALLKADSRYLAAAGSSQTGDGANAARLALVGETASALLGNQGVQVFHAGLVTGVGIAAAGALAEQEAADTVYSGLLAQRESISGVSLDEEAINLTRFERAYEGAARYFSVIDSLTAQVMNLSSV